MKLEYLAKANAGGSGDDLIRLYDFTAVEVQLLAHKIKDSLVLKGKALQMEPLEFINPVNCKLNLTLSDTDNGIHQDAPNRFTCALTRSGYLRMVDLMEPLMKEGSVGFQWLYDLSSDATPTEFLLSPNGNW